MPVAPPTVVARRAAAGRTAESIRFSLGHQWTYDVTELGSFPLCPSGTHSGKVVSEGMIDGKDAFQTTNLCAGVDPSYYAVDGDVVQVDYQGTWILALDAPVEEGHTWSNGSSTFTWHKEPKVTVPAGSFDNCWRATQNVDYEAYTIFCRGVGPVHWHSKVSHRERLRRALEREELLSDASRGDVSPLAAGPGDLLWRWASSPGGVAMARTGWKGKVIVAAASAVLSSSAHASAQPKAGPLPPDPTKSAPRLVLPKIDVHPQRAAWAPATMDPAAAQVVHQVVDAMHRFAAQVSPASVAPPAPRPHPVAAPAKAERPRPAPAGVVVTPKPVVIDQPVTGVDAHGLNGEVPGIQIRMPWRVP